MKKYFYKTNPYFKKVLEKQINMKMLEDDTFRAAMLAYLNNKPTYPLDKMYEEIMDSTIPQQKAYADSNHQSQLFKHFHALHIASRNIRILSQQDMRMTEGLIDPDKFPIYDTMTKFKKWRTGWPSVMNLIRKRLGFQLVVKNSTLQHIDANKGLFLQSEKSIPVGTLLGFVPGELYQIAGGLKEALAEKKYERLQFLEFSEDVSLIMTKIFISPCQYQLEGRFANPYALGQMVNHPAPRHSANVCFQRVNIKKGLFPSHLMRFLPYNLKNADERDPTIPAIGIFSLRELKSGEELFVNYLQHHRYPIDDIPQWLVEPVPLSPYMIKNQYQHVQGQFWFLLDRIALKQHQKEYEKFMQTVRYEPDRYEFERKGEKYKKLNLVKFKKFEQP